jgi:hypothetical protein
MKCSRIVVQNLVLNSEPVFVKFKEHRNRFCQAGNRFLGSIKGLEIRARNAKPPFYVRVIQRIYAVLHSSVYEYMPRRY